RFTSCSTILPYTTLFRAVVPLDAGGDVLPLQRERPAHHCAFETDAEGVVHPGEHIGIDQANIGDVGFRPGAKAQLGGGVVGLVVDRKSTRLNSSNVKISY